jgi:hypothetical protein
VRNERVRTHRRRERSYRKWFRQIVAPQASRTRCGRWIEADEAGAPATAIQANLTHGGADMTRRYLRGDDEQKIVEVADARKRKRGRHAFRKQKRRVRTTSEQSVRTGHLSY